MRAKLILGLGALAAVAVTVAAIVQISTLALLRPAPEVRFTPLSGEAFFTSELRGKVVLVNFWATYCTSCLREMPQMVETHRRFSPRGYETVAVAVRHDNPNRVVEFAANRALPFKVTLDSRGEAAKQFGNVRITPTSFLLDKQGRVLRRYVGEPDWKELHEIVERELDA